MNTQGAKEPEIEAALGAALGATGDAQEQALTDLNRAITANGWYIPVYEDFTYAGYNADKVAEPAFAGTNNYLVPPGDPARELTLATGRWPRSDSAATGPQLRPPAPPARRGDPTCSATSHGGSPWPSAPCSPRC